MRRTSETIANVCNGSLADIKERISDVRFTPESRHFVRHKKVRYVPEADITSACADQHCRTASVWWSEFVGLEPITRVGRVVNVVS